MTKGLFALLLAGTLTVRTSRLLLEMMKLSDLEPVEGIGRKLNLGRSCRFHRSLISRQCPG